MVVAIAAGLRCLLPAAARHDGSVGYTSTGGRQQPAQNLNFSGACNGDTWNQRSLELACISYAWLGGSSRQLVQHTPQLDPPPPCLLPNQQLGCLRPRPVLKRPLSLWVAQWYQPDANGSAMVT